MLSLTPAAKEFQVSFGETLQRLRRTRGIKAHRLALEATIAPSSVTRMESGERGLPELQTLVSMSDALHLTTLEKRMLFEAGLADRLREESQKLAVYYYVYLASDTELERTARAIQERIKDNWQIRNELGKKGLSLDSSAAHDLILAVANMPEWAHWREAFAYYVLKAISIDLQEGTVEIEDGPILADLLAEDFEDADAKLAALVAVEQVREA